MKVIKTGVNSVDELYGVDFTGNVIPHSWFKAIQTANGRPDLAAIVILAEILYWHRPTVERAADDDAVIVLKKKFHADLLQMSYAQIEKKLFLSKAQSRRALEKLESLGLIERCLRTVVTESGSKLGNVMYIKLFTQRLLDITFPGDDPCKKFPNRVSAETDKVIGKNRQACLSEPMTNTKISTEITNIDYTSFYQQEKAKVRDQVDYEYLIKDRKNDRGIIDNLVDLITDMNISSKQFQKINGEPIPTDIVRERLSRIDREVMESVIDKIKLATKPVTNLRGYLLTTLFNEPVVYETGIEMQVTQDMHRREAEAWQS